MKHANPGASQHHPALTLRQGRTRKPANITLTDVIAFVETSGTRNLRILSRVMGVKAMERELPNFTLDDIPLGNLLRFAATANPTELRQLEQVLSDRRAAL